MLNGDPQLSIDERWMADWIEYGFDELGRYMRRYAAFTEWLDLNPAQSHDPSTRRR
jgi:hypothetical protein